MKKTTIIILAISCFMVAVSMSAKPTLEIKQLNSFSIAEPSFDPNFSMFCVTDSLIIAVDNADSTNYKTFCYDYQGNKVNAFKLPTLSKYRQPFFINYLFGRKQIAVQNWYGIDYFNVRGDSVGHMEVLDDQTMFSGASVYLSCVEYDSLLYFRLYRVMEAADREINTVTSSTAWLKEFEDGQIQPLRKIFQNKEITQAINAKPFPNWCFLLDANMDKQMAYAEEGSDKYLVRFYTDNKSYSFEIKRPDNDYLNTMYTGKNFLILMNVEKNFKTSKTAGVYDLKGNKVTSLSALKDFYREDKDMGVVDIVGNKAFVLNAKDKIVSIYEVMLTQD